MGFDHKYQLHLGLILKAVTTLGMTISYYIFWSWMEKVLQDGGRGKGNGKETHQRLL